MRLLFLFASILLLFSACKDPGTIGVGLLGDDELNIDFTDEVLVKAKIIPGDSIIINPIYAGKSIGIVEEPVFGNTTNQLFVDTRASLFNLPEFTDSVLDSVILRVPLREDIAFGDPEAIHHVEVFQLLEKFEDGKEALGDALDSSSELEYGDLLGDTMFVADYETTIIIRDHIASDDTTTIELAPHLRVKLDDSFGEQFMGLSTDELPDSTYRNMAKGFLIRNTPSANNLLALNFNAIEGGGQLEFFYTKSDSLKRIYTARVGSDRFLNVNHEYDGSGSEVEAALNNLSDDQEILYQEPYAGTNIQFDLSGLKDFKDKVINNVCLELTLAEVANYDYELYPAIPNLIMTYRNEDDVIILISDISTVGISPEASEVAAIFGGVLDEDSTTGDMVYRMDLTNHALQLINDELGDNYLVTIKAFFENESPNRSIIHGNGVSGKGPKLKLVITEP